MIRPTALSDDLFQDLAALVQDGQVLTDDESLRQYSHDDAEWAPFETPWP